MKNVWESSSKTWGVFRTQASIYDGAFLRIYLTVYYFDNKSSIIDVRLGYIHIGLRKYWNVQSEANVEQIIAIVSTCSVSCYVFNYRIDFKCCGVMMSISSRRILGQLWSWAIVLGNILRLEDWFPNLDTFSCTNPAKLIKCQLWWDC